MSAVSGVAPVAPSSPKITRLLSFASSTKTGSFAMRVGIALTKAAPPTSLAYLAAAYT